MSTSRCPTCQQLMSTDNSARSRRSQGGLTLLADRGPAYFRELGRKGGRPRLPRYTDKEKASQPVGVSREEHHNERSRR